MKLKIRFSLIFGKTNENFNIFFLFTSPFAFPFSYEFMQIFGKLLAGRVKGPLPYLVRARKNIRRLLLEQFIEINFSVMSY